MAGRESAVRRWAGREARCEPAQRALGDSDGVVVHAENKRSDRVDIALCQPLQHGGVLARLIESFIDVFQIGGVDGFHTDKDPLAAGGRDQVDQFFVAQKVRADLRYPKHLRSGRDDVAQQRLGALDVDGKIIVDEEDGDLSLLVAGARF